MLQALSPDFVDDCGLSLDLKNQGFQHCFAAIPLPGVRPLSAFLVFTRKRHGTPMARFCVDYYCLNLDRGYSPNKTNALFYQFVTKATYQRCQGLYCLSE
jgi:hypothetical protein